MSRGVMGIDLGGVIFGVGGNEMYRVKLSRD